MHVPVFVLKNTVPRVATEGSSSRKVNRTGGVRKSVKKVLATVAEIINSAGTPTLVSICDRVRKQCSVHAAEASMLVQNIRSACQHAVRSRLLSADGQLFSLTDAGTELLNSCQNAASASIDLLLDKLLAQKVSAMLSFAVVC